MFSVGSLLGIPSGILGSGFTPNDYDVMALLAGVGISVISFLTSLYFDTKKKEKYWNLVGEEPQMEKNTNDFWKRHSSYSRNKTEINRRFFGGGK